MQIRATPDIEQGLLRHADLLGTSPQDVAISALRDRFLPAHNGPAMILNGDEVVPLEGESMYDFLKEFIGCVDSSEHIPGRANVSVDTGKKFAEIGHEKHRG